MPRPARRLDDPAPPAPQLLLFDSVVAGADASAADLIPGKTAQAQAPAAVADPGPGLPQHPQADRRVQLNGQWVAYQLLRARRRSIGFVVSTDGLRVSAPRWVTLAAIDEALQTKAGWILRKLAEQRQRGQRQQAAQVAWGEGAVLPYLGQALRLTLRPGLRGAQQVDGPDGPVLQLGLPVDAAPAQVGRLLQRWLQQQALALFSQRCQHHAAGMGVAPSRLGLSAARTRWGSASASGAIRLNWRLIHLPLSVIDYVVVHELAHLREMNHSPRFWAIVAAVLPDHDQARRQLKDAVLPVFD